MKKTEHYNKLQNIQLSLKQLSYTDVTLQEAIELLTSDPNKSRNILLKIINTQKQKGRMDQLLTFKTIIFILVLHILHKDEGLIRIYSSENLEYWTRKFYESFTVQEKHYIIEGLKIVFSTTEITPYRSNRDYVLKALSQKLLYDKDLFNTIARSFEIQLQIQNFKNCFLILDLLELSPNTQNQLVILEIFNLELKTIILSGNNQRLWQLIPKIHSIPQDSTNGGIKREIEGMLFLASSNYKQSFIEFRESFIEYVKENNPRSLIVLRYTILLSILSNTDFQIEQILDTQQIPEPEQKYIFLRTAFDQEDSIMYRQVLKEINTDQDLILCYFRNELWITFCLKAQIHDQNLKFLKFSNPKEEEYIPYQQDFPWQKYLLFIVLFFNFIHLVLMFFFFIVDFVFMDINTNIESKQINLKGTVQGFYESTCERGIHLINVEYQDAYNNLNCNQSQNVNLQTCKIFNSLQESYDYLLVITIIQAINIIIGIFLKKLMWNFITYKTSIRSIKQIQLLFTIFMLIMILLSTLNMSLNAHWVDHQWPSIFQEYKCDLPIAPLLQKCYQQADSCQVKFRESSIVYAFIAIIMLIVLELIFYIFIVGCELVVQCSKGDILQELENAQEEQREYRQNQIKMGKYRRKQEIQLQMINQSNEEEDIEEEQSFDSDENQEEDEEEYEEEEKIDLGRKRGKNEYEYEID